MSNQISHPVIIPEVMENNMPEVSQLTDINFKFEIKNELVASAQEGAKLIRSMLRENVKEISETEPEVLSKIKTIHIFQPVEIRFGNPELIIELK